MRFGLTRRSGVCVSRSVDGVDLRLTIHHFRQAPNQRHTFGAARAKLCPNVSSRPDVTHTFLPGYEFMLGWFHVPGARTHTLNHRGLLVGGGGGEGPRAGFRNERDGPMIAMTGLWRSSSLLPRLLCSCIHPLLQSTYARRHPLVWTTRIECEHDGATSHRLDAGCWMRCYSTDGRPTHHSDMTWR